MGISMGAVAEAITANPILGFIVLLCLGATIVNGATDAPNAIATVVGTRAMRPGPAIIMAAVCNFIGMVLITMVSTAVASTIFGMVDFGGDNDAALTALAAAMAAIIVWGAVAWAMGIPTSQSHSLIAGITGAAIALQGGPIYQTGWQDSMTMYYYSWNLAPAMVCALFYVTLGYGRTLREFVVYNCLLPACVNCVWYTVFGGTAMLSILGGSDLYQVIQQFGDGISTFAFLDLLPAGGFFKWFFIIVAILTFLTFSDSIAFSFPMLFMKETEPDASKTRVPKALNVAVAMFMGVLTLLLLYVGGYDALSECMVVIAFPAAIVLLLVCLSVFKFLFHREEYDVTYQEELAASQATDQVVFDDRVEAAVRKL